MLPASFYVRAGGWEGLFAPPALAKVVADFAQAGSFIGHPWQWALYILGLLHVVMKRDVRLAPLVLFPWLLTYFLGNENLQIIGGTFLGHRYIVPGLPFFLVGQLFGGAFVTDLLFEKKILHRSYRKRFLPPLVAAITLLILIGDPRVVARRLDEQRAEYIRACADIEQMQVNIGRWLAANTPSDATIGTHDAGAIAYFSGRRIVDIFGLNTPHIKPLDPQMIARLDYLVTFAQQPPSVEAPYLAGEVYRVHLDKPTVVPAADMVVYKIHEK